MRDERSVENKMEKKEKKLYARIEQTRPSHQKIFFLFSDHNDFFLFLLK